MPTYTSSHIHVGLYKKIAVIAYSFRCSYYCCSSPHPSTRSNLHQWKNISHMWNCMSKNMWQLPTGVFAVYSSMCHWLLLPIGTGRDGWKLCTSKCMPRYASYIIINTTIIDVVKSVRWIVYTYYTCTKSSLLGSPFITTIQLQWLLPRLNLSNQLVLMAKSSRHAVLLVLWPVTTTRTLQLVALMNVLKVASALKD